MRVTDAELTAGHLTDDTVAGLLSELAANGHVLLEGALRVDRLA